MPSWPSELPELPLAGKYTETPPNLLLRTNMDVGPAKVRRRFTAGVRDANEALLITEDQVEILDNFFMTDLMGGALSFDWVNARNGASVSLRFKKPPQYSHFAYIWYDVSMELEIMP